SAYKMGAIDLVATGNGNLQEYIGTIGYSSKEMKGRTHTFLALNNSNYFLGKQEVRKAISYSLDKNNLVATVFGDKGYTSSFPLDYGSWLCQEQDASSGYNPEHAGEILIEAGWTLRSGVWQKIENYKTQKLALNLLVKANDQTKVLVAENIKNQLANQGIIINIIQAQEQQYNEMINARNYDIALCSMIMAPSPNMETYFGEGNLSNYINMEVNTILEETKNTTDRNIILEKYKRLIEIYKTDMPYISLYNNKYIVAYNSALVGEITPNWFYQFYGIEGWYK
ncbi:MAG: hypothetical protein HUJ68_01515, partial [Clostridia bacterium]|nr:hypothetical protein [Clostridia bacterium]